MERKNIETPSGFRWSINPAALDDLLVIEDLAALDGGDVLKVPSVLERLLGSDGKAALYDHLRTEDGRVPISALSSAIADTIAALGDTGKK